MHELALIQGIIKICREKAKAEQALSIKSITLEIGEFAGVSLPSLEFGFEVASRGTMAQNASLGIEEIPAQGECPTCGATYQGLAALDICPQCQTPLTLLQGRELRVKSMEIEECAKTAAV